jgi:hypothetical protein
MKIQPRSWKLKQGHGNLTKHMETKSKVMETPGHVNSKLWKFKQEHGNSDKVMEIQTNPSSRGSNLFILYQTLFGGVQTHQVGVRTLLFCTKGWKP